MSIPMLPIVRYESNHWFIKPFETGLRHLKLATCDGSEQTLLNLAKERIIYRPQEGINAYQPLTTRNRIYHFTVGTLETAGYLTLIIPFITAIADYLLNKPHHPYNEDAAFKTHIEEGGSSGAEPATWRKNPFDTNGGNDLFYQGASWLPQKPAVFA